MRLGLLLRQALLAAGLLSLACSAGSRATAEVEPIGPAPVAADGRFTNTGGELDHGSLGVRLPFFLRRVVSSFRSRPGAPAVVENDGDFLRDNAQQDAAQSVPTLTWIGHATLLVQMDGVTFLTDPSWSDTASPVSFAGPPRFVPPGLAMALLPAIDFVLVSHNHYDHMDLTSLAALARRSPDTRFIVPLGNAAVLRSAQVSNVTELDWGQSTEVQGLQLVCLPARHWSKRGLGDDNKALWSSWGVIGRERRFYFAGDSGYAPEDFQRIAAHYGPFDLAALPVGAYQPVAMMQASHMNPEQAVLAAGDLQATNVVAMHYGTFDLSDEPLDEPPRRFRAAATAAGFTPASAWVMAVGETRRF